MCARNATERHRSARGGLAAGHQHVAAPASSHANIFTRTLFRNNIIGSNRLFSAATAVLPSARGTGSLAPVVILSLHPFQLRRKSVYARLAAAPSRHK